MKLKVTNWPEYEAGLRRRGSLTLWMTPEALSCWPAPKRKTRGGQPRYSDLAIETALTLGQVFGLRLRHTVGFLASSLQLMGLDLAIPDHTTLSRRARKPRTPDKRQVPHLPQKGPVHVLIDSTGLQIFGTDQWLEEKHGAKSRRNRHWMPTAARSSHTPDRHIEAINTDGRMKWQVATGYAKRSLVETADRPLQIDHRPPTTGALILRPRDRSCHRAAPSSIE